jgi:hypothetical protein
VDPPGEWTRRDAIALNGFLNGSDTGNKLRCLLLHAVYEAALKPGKKTHYEQGVTDGRNNCLGMILALATVPEPDDEEDAGQ